MSTLRVLSYNVRGLRDDTAALHRVIRASGAHLVFLQEVPKIFRWRTRLADLARRTDRVVVTGGARAGGNALIATVAITVHATRDVLLPLTPGQQLRGAATASLSLAGHRFSAASAHLSLLPSERGGQVARLLTELPHGPLVLAGDLNETPGGAVTRLLSDRLVDAASGDETPTFPTYGPDKRIDYIWAQAPMRVEKYEVIASPDAFAGSDHLPVYAELAL